MSRHLPLEAPSPLSVLVCLHHWRSATNTDAMMYALVIGLNAPTIPFMLAQQTIDPLKHYGLPVSDLTP